MNYPIVGLDASGKKIIYVIGDLKKNPDEFWDTHQYQTRQGRTRWYRKDLFKSNQIYELTSEDLQMMKNSIKSLFEKGIKE